MDQIALISYPTITKDILDKCDINAADNDGNHLLNLFAKTYLDEQTEDDVTLDVESLNLTVLYMLANNRRIEVIEFIVKLIDNIPMMLEDKIGFCLNIAILNDLMVHVICSDSTMFTDKEITLKAMYDGMYKGDFNDMRLECGLGTVNFKFKYVDELPLDKFLKLHHVITPYIQDA